MDKITTVRNCLESLIGLPVAKNTLIYRGQVNYNWKIKPTLLRREIKDEHILEKSLLWPLYQNVKIPFLEGKDPFEYLAILQHYNIETRLLDMTKDPLIALFFACYEKNEIYEEDGSFMICFKDHFKDCSLLHFDNEFLVKDYNELMNSSLKERINQTEPVFFDSFFPNARLRNQNGCFIVFPFLPLELGDMNYMDLLTYNSLVIEKLKKENEESAGFLLFKKVAKENKKQILHELDTIYNISYNSLFVNSPFSSNIEEELKKMYKEIIIKFPRLKEIYNEIIF